MTEEQQQLLERVCEQLASFWRELDELRAELRDQRMPGSGRRRSVRIAAVRKPTPAQIRKASGACPSLRRKKAE